MVYDLMPLLTKNFEGCLFTLCQRNLNWSFLGFQVLVLLRHLMSDFPLGTFCFMFHLGKTDAKMPLSFSSHLDTF